MFNDRVGVNVCKIVGDSHIVVAAGKRFSVTNDKKICSLLSSSFSSRRASALRFRNVFAMNPTILPRL